MEGLITLDLNNFNIGERDSFPSLEHLNSLSMQLPEPLDWRPLACIPESGAWDWTFSLL